MTAGLEPPCGLHARPLVPPLLHSYQFLSPVLPLCSRPSSLLDTNPLSAAMPRLVAFPPAPAQLYTTLTGAPVPEVALDKWARRQLLTAHSQQPLQELTKTVAGLLDVLYLVDCHSMTLTVGSVVDGILLAISKGMPAGMGQGVNRPALRRACGCMIHV